YRFHLALQQLHRQVVFGIQETHAAINLASGNRELSQQQFADVRGWMNDAAGKLGDALDRSEKIRLPALRSVEAGQLLRQFLLQNPVIDQLAADSNNIDGKWVGDLMGQLTEVEDKLKRLLFKSLGGILAAQEKIVTDWQRRSETPQTPAAV